MRIRPFANFRLCDCSILFDLHFKSKSCPWGQLLIGPGRHEEEIPDGSVLGEKVGPIVRVGVRGFAQDFIEESDGVVIVVWHCPPGWRECEVIGSADHNRGTSFGGISHGERRRAYRLADRITDTRPAQPSSKSRD